jgi:hypothetical protein
MNLMPAWVLTVNFDHNCSDILPVFGMEAITFQKLPLIKLQPNLKQLRNLHSYFVSKGLIQRGKGRLIRLKMSHSDPNSGKTIISSKKYCNRINNWR